jgi:hypothetical protein
LYFKERKNTQNTVKKAPYVGWWAVIYAKVIGADSFEEKLLCYSKIYGTIFRLPTAFYQRKLWGEPPEEKCLFVVCDAEKTEEVINSGMFEHKGRITSEVRAQDGESQQTLSGDQWKEVSQVAVHGFVPTLLGQLHEICARHMKQLMNNPTVVNTTKPIALYATMKRMMYGVIFEFVFGTPLAEHPKAETVVAALEDVINQIQGLKSKNILLRKGIYNIVRALISTAKQTNEYEKELVLDSILTSKVGKNFCEHRMADMIVASFLFMGSINPAEVICHTVYELSKNSIWQKKLLT